MDWKPWYLLNPKLAHDLSLPLLNLIEPIVPRQNCQWGQFEWNHLKFKNPLGIAGGVDKNAAAVPAWWKLGLGFVEIGTVTPLPQSPNSGIILNRSIKEMALWNKMGFPNKGCEALKKRLGALKPKETPLFINIGKNRQTPNDKAHEDYIKCIKELTPFADAFVINISSPNTQGLRELLLPENLHQFLAPIVKANNAHIPLLLKISPDIENQQLESILSISLKNEVSGWILTNTTNQRTKNSQFPAEGGVSGKPLAQQSKKLLSDCLQWLGGKRQGKLIISAGGVMTPEDVFERLDMGADLVQVYSALVFNGPFFFKQVSEKKLNLL